MHPYQHTLKMQAELNAKHSKEHKQASLFKTSINLSPMLITQLDKLCTHYGENQSQCIRRLIIDAYARHALKLKWELYEDIKP